MAGLQEAELAPQTLEWLTGCILDALARGERVDAAALQFLLRRYASDARDDLTEPLGAAFALEMDRRAGDGAADDSDRWMAVFAEAAAMSDDPRLGRAATDLLQIARGRWTAGEPYTVDEIMRAVEGCLLCVHLPDARELAAEAVDVLERVTAAAYRPG